MSVSLGWSMRPPGAYLFHPSQHVKFTLRRVARDAVADCFRWTVMGHDERDPSVEVGTKVVSVTGLRSLSLLGLDEGFFDPRLLIQPSRKPLHRRSVSNTQLVSRTLFG